VIERVRGNLEALRSTPARLTAEVTAWVEEVLTRGDEALRQRFQPCFVHGDYNYNNVAMQRGKAGWRVSGVFDLMTPHFGDGEADVSRQTAMFLDEDAELARAYLQAYLRRRPARPGFLDRFPVYMLDDRLVVWLYAQIHQVDWWDRSLTLWAWAEPYLSVGSLLLSRFDKGH
jgi:aminoglycoside phosphotransferase (APT) family kinase protein